MSFFIRKFSSNYIFNLHKSFNSYRNDENAAPFTLNNLPKHSFLNSNSYISRESPYLTLTGTYGIWYRTTNRSPLSLDTTWHLDHIVSLYRLHSATFVSIRALIYNMPCLVSHNDSYWKIVSLLCKVTMLDASNNGIW